LLTLAGSVELPPTEPLLPEEPVPWSAVLPEVLPLWVPGVPVCDPVELPWPDMLPVAPLPVVEPLVPVWPLMEPADPVPWSLVLPVPVCAPVPLGDCVALELLLLEPAPAPELPVCANSTETPKHRNTTNKMLRI